MAHDSMHELLLVGGPARLEVFDTNALGDDGLTARGTLPLFGGRATDLAIHGTDAWILYGSIVGDQVGLLGVDLRNPELPRPGARVNFDGEAALPQSSLVIMSGGLAVVSLQHELAVFRIDDVDAPERIGALPIETIQTFGMVAADADSVWVMHYDWNGSLVILRVSIATPTAPVIIGRTTVTTSTDESLEIPVARLIRVGTQLVVATATRLYVLSPRDQALDVEGRLQSPGGRLWSGLVAGDGRPIAISQDAANLNDQARSVHVIDLTVAGSPSIGTTTVAQYGCQFDGRPAEIGRGLILGCNGALVRASLGDAEPSFALLRDGVGPTRAIVATAHGILSTRGDELVLRAATAPFAVKAETSLPPANVPHRLIGLGDRVFLVSDGSVLPVAVGPAELRIGASIAQLDPFVSRFDVLHGRYLLIPANSEAGEASVEIHDLALDGSPIIHRAVIADDRLVASVVGHGDRVVAELLRPRPNNTIEVRYLAVDFTTIEQPRLGQRIQTFDDWIMSDAAFDGSLLWATQSQLRSVGDARVVAIDFSDIDQPRQRSGRATAMGPEVFGYGLALSRHGRHLFVADGQGGASVIDIADPDRPARAGRIDTADFASGVAWFDKHLGIADTSSLLLISWPDAGNTCTDETYEAVDGSCQPNLAPSCEGGGACCLEQPLCDGETSCFWQLETCRRSCDAVAQDCPAGDGGCTIWPDERFGCRPLGTVPVGGECSFDELGFDDCVKGSVCFYDELFAQYPICHAYCRVGDDGACGDPADFECYPFASEFGIGVCLVRDPRGAVPDLAHRSGGQFRSLMRRDLRFGAAMRQISGRFHRSPTQGAPWRPVSTTASAPSSALSMMHSRSRVE